MLRIYGTDEELKAFDNGNHLTEENGEKIFHPTISEENKQTLERSVNGRYYKWLNNFAKDYFRGLKEIGKFSNDTLTDFESKEDYQAFKEVKQHCIHYLSPKAVVPLGRIITSTVSDTATSKRKSWQLIFMLEGDSITDFSTGILNIANNWNSLKVVHGICLPDGRILEFVYQNTRTKRFLLTYLPNNTYSEVRMKP